MNYLQTNPDGIDAIIQMAQQRMYDLYLIPMLGLTTDNCLSFGRIYRNQVSDVNKQTGYVPQAFYQGKYIGASGNSNGNDLFFEKGKIVSFFYVAGNKKTVNAGYKADVELYVFADMSLVVPSGITTEQQRLDEILLNGFENFITYNGCGFAVTATYFDIDKVLERWTGTAKRNALTRNMSGTSDLNQPSFCALRLNLEIHYDPLAYQNNQPQIQNNPRMRNLVFFIKAVPNPANTYTVGNGVEIYKEYAPGNTLTVTRVDNNRPYLANYDSTMVALTLNGENDPLEAWSAGVWDRTASNGFNDGDYPTILFDDLT